MAAAIGGTTLAPVLILIVLPVLSDMGSRHAVPGTLAEAQAEPAE